MIIIVNLGDHTHAAKGQMKTRLGDKRAKQRRGHGAKAPVTCRASVARSSNKEKLDAGEESGLLRCPRVLARNPFTGGRRYDGSLRVRSSMHSTLPMTLFFMTTVLLCAANDWTLGRVTSHAPNTANVTERLDIIEIQKRITQIVIVVEDDCPVSFQADEELEKRCISLWKHHHVEESIKTKQANDDGCGVFPIFRKESRGLKYKVL